MNLLRYVDLEMMGRETNNGASRYGRLSLTTECLMVDDTIAGQVLRFDLEFMSSELSQFEWLPEGLV